MSQIYPVLTIDDVEYAHRGGFVADPFVVTQDRVDYLFFEVFYRAPREKTIGCAKRKNGKEWKYLGMSHQDSNFEYSFPYLFEHDSEMYMVPSIANSDGTRPKLKLYRAADFPLRWVVESEFDVQGADPVLISWNGSWFLICKTDRGLMLYFSDRLETTEWIKHPMSPLELGSRYSRMGGRPLVRDEKLYLMYQDCYHHYGEMVRCCEVQVLDRVQFQQTEIDASPIVCGQYSNEWNHLGMHHVDFNLDADFAIVDGHDQNGWTIGLVECGNDLSRLVPAPEQFTIQQSFARQRQLVINRFKIIDTALDYQKKHGIGSLIRRATERLRT